MHRLLDIKEVTRAVKLSKATVYTKIREGKFPKQIRLGANTVAWEERDIDSWIEQRLAENNHKPWAETAGARV